MDKATYTMGPWRIPQPWSGFSEIRGANDELVFGLAAGCEGEKQPDEICEANARLIAAAPDLVEALDGPDPDAPECIKPLSWLHSMVAHCKARGPAPDDDDPAAFHDMIGEVEALYVRARAALSKALGEGHSDNG